MQDTAILLAKEDSAMRKAAKILDSHEVKDFERDVSASISASLNEITHIQKMLEESLEEGESDYRVRLLEAHMSILINQNWLIIDQLAKMNKKMSND